MLLPLSKSPSGSSPSLVSHSRSSSIASLPRRLPSRLTYPLLLALLGLAGIAYYSPTPLSFSSLRLPGVPTAALTSTSTSVPAFSPDTIPPPPTSPAAEDVAASTAFGDVLLSDPVWFLARSGRRDPWQSPTPALPLSATTEARLRAWELDSPRAEGAELVKWSAQTCQPARASPNQNAHMLEISHLLWSSLNASSIVAIRQSMIGFLRGAIERGDLDEDRWGEGRGLVFTAGNADTFKRVLLTLRMLRIHLETDIPAEIFSYPGEQPEESLLPEFEKVGAKLRVLDDFSRDTSKSKNYQIKASAIVRTSFREVLYLDSDNLVAGGLGNDSSSEPDLNSPWYSGLWEAKSYQRLGVMMWPDYWRTTADNPIWQILGVQCRDEWEQEAGQLLVDKSRHLDALLLAEWMLKDWRFWFNFSDGDKDIFRFAFLALRKRWGLPGRYVGAGALPGDTMTGFCGHTMLQHDHLGRPLFVHMNLLKQIPSGVGRGYSWGRTRTIKGFPDDEGEEHVDWDVDADMLANAANDGIAIGSAPPEVRQRAAAERGLRPFFHGGFISAVCIDLRWEDPRTVAEREADKEAYLQWVQKHPPNRKPEPIEGEGEAKEEKSEEELRKEAAEKTTLASDGKTQIVWESPLEVRQWSEDPRLKDFEDRFYKLGGSPNGKGF